MSYVKAAIAAAFAAAMLAASAFAGSFGPEPSNYETAAADYVSSRLINPRASKIRFVGGPYKAYADIGGYRDVAAWAVDVRVKSRLPSGGWSGYMAYTVIFVDGDPIAFEQDARRLSRL